MNKSLYTNLKFDKRYIQDEEYHERKDKRYIDMINYFDNYCDNENKKAREKAYKEKVKYRKIKEKYELMEKTGKVLKKDIVKNNRYISL